DFGEWGFDDRRAGLEGLQKMTPSEQERYRTDEDFKKAIDTRVEDIFLPGSQRDAANLILERIKNNQKTGDVVVDLSTYAQDFDANEGEVVRTVQEAFRKDPGLHERILNPKTEEEKIYSEKFKQLLPAALGNGIFDNDADYYGKELLEKGEISIEKRMNLSSGYFDDDEKSAYKDFLYANPEETKRLLNDPEYQRKVLFYMSKEERELAINNLKERDRLIEERKKIEQKGSLVDQDIKLSAEEKEQAKTAIKEQLNKSDEHIDKFYGGEMRPEDALRCAVLGFGADEVSMKRVLNNIPPGQIDAVKNAYVQKYGVTLSSDISYEYSDLDSTSALRLMKSSANSQEEDLAEGLDQYSKSRGFGANFVRSSWDGTADQTDKSIHDLVAKISKANGDFNELTVEERRAGLERLHERVGDLVNSKEALGNVVADVAITAVAIGGCVVGNPETLGLLAFTTFATTLGLTGAAIKVSIKSAVMGNNYTTTMAYADLASGFVDAGLNVLGPAQVGKLFQIGRKTSERTATTLAQKLLERNLLKTVTGEGAEVLTETTILRAPTRILTATDNLVMNSIVSGAKKFDDNAVNAAARRMVDPEIGEVAYRKAISENLSNKAANQLREKAIVDASQPISIVLRESLQENVALSTNALMRYSTAAAFNSIGGALGGGGSGLVYSSSQFDMTRSLSENIENIGKATLMSAIIGGGAGGGLSTIFKGAGDLYSFSKTPRNTFGEDLTEDLTEDSTGLSSRVSNETNSLKIEDANPNTSRPENVSANPINANASFDQADTAEWDFDTLPSDPNANIYRTSLPEVTSTSFLNENDLVRPLNYVEQLEWMKLSLRRKNNEQLQIVDEARWIQLNKRISEKDELALQNAKNLKTGPGEYNLEYKVPVADNDIELRFDRGNEQFEFPNEAGLKKLPKLSAQERLISGTETELRWLPSRKYKAAGLFEIVVPEKHAIMLDKLRKLRIYVEENPEEGNRLMHFFKNKNALLPEEILHSSRLLPNANRVTRIELSGENSPTWKRAAADAHTEKGVLRIFAPTTAKDLDEYLMHEWAHLTELNKDV
ncbi:MAG: hypothetical protein IAF58_05120, partial [Leptolyngbya sp.]|nr:hypothetical protein [Candidatus Melainabacteria bacterium]